MLKEVAVERISKKDEQSLARDPWAFFSRKAIGVLEAGRARGVEVGGQGLMDALDKVAESAFGDQGDEGLQERLLELESLLVRPEVKAALPFFGTGVSIGEDGAIELIRGD